MPLGSGTAAMQLSVQQCNATNQAAAQRCASGVHRARQLQPTLLTRCRSNANEQAVSECVRSFTEHPGLGRRAVLFAALTTSSLMQGSTLLLQPPPARAVENIGSPRALTAEEQAAVTAALSRVITKPKVWSAVVWCCAVLWCCLSVPPLPLPDSAAPPTSVRMRHSRRAQPSQPGWS